ncbi:S8 family serine peptidase [Microbacterium sp.]|uniref:S8 family serine peptidase n=1 Tax=Microbacterium sp. TaxID=51671 RepID=UPI003F9A52AD
MRRPARLIPALVLAIAAIVTPAAASASDAPTTVLPAATSGQTCTAENPVLAPQTPEALLLLGAEDAHLTATGKGVVVAVVDSGIDASNPHLSPAVIGGIDLVGDGERSDGLTDMTGHGTAIAGQIAARPVTGSGVVGLAPDAELLSVRVYRSDADQDVKAGFGPTAQRIADGIRWAADHGADVINVSLSQATDSVELRSAVEHAAAVGALVVASGGNRASDPEAPDGPRYPAAYEQALGVTATDAGGRVTADSIHGPQVDVSAPGMNILTTAIGAGNCLFATETPAASYATAYASAAAALVAEAHPEDPAAGWAYRLSATALRADPDHRDDAAGWGFIQPSAAIALLPDRSTRGPVSPFFDTTEAEARPPAVAIAPDLSSVPFILTREAALYAAIGGASLLGVLGILIVFRRRRAASDDAPPELGSGGLLERDEPEEQY